MKVPGWVIGLFLVLLDAAVRFLATGEFAGVDWAPFVVLVLTTIISAIRLAQTLPAGGTARGLPYSDSRFATWWMKG